MDTTTPQTATQAMEAGLLWPRLAAALIGTFIIGMVGFSHMTVAHNAGHDYRHSMAFPCH